MSREGFLSQPVEALMNRFRITDELTDVAEAEIVFECVTEDLKLKRELFRQLECVVSSDCVLATNTSAIPISFLQHDAQHPERIVLVGAGLLVAALAFIGWRITAGHLVHSSRTQPRLNESASGNMHIVPLTRLSGAVGGPAFSPDGGEGCILLEWRRNCTPFRPVCAVSRGRCIPELLRDPGALTGTDRIGSQIGVAMCAAMR